MNLRRKIETLDTADDYTLRIWMRRVWAKVNPQQVTDWYDLWEGKLFSFIAWDSYNERDVSLALAVRDRARRITCTVLRQPPYQAIRP